MGRTARITSSSRTVLCSLIKKKKIKIDTSYNSEPEAEREGMGMCKFVCASACMFG